MKGGLGGRGGSYHDCTVLGPAGDDLVVMWTPVDVQHRACVSAHCGVGLVDPARLLKQNKCELDSKPRLISSVTVSPHTPDEVNSTPDVQLNRSI